MSYSESILKKILDSEVKDSSQIKATCICNKSN